MNKSFKDRKLPGRLKFFCSALLTLCLFARPVFADPSGLARAAGLLRAGNAEGAYRAYLALLREEPDSDEANLGLARASMAASHPHQAIMAYERMIAKYPSEFGLYREIASAYMSIGDSDMAMRYLSHDTSLAPDDISAWASRVGAAYSRFQSQGKLRFGVMYDSNGNQGPDSNSITLGNIPVILIGAEKEGGFGGWLAGDCYAAYRTSRSGPWWAVGDAHFYSRLLGSSGLRALDRDHSQWYRLAGGIRHSSPTSLFDLRVKGEIFDYDFYDTVYSFGPELTYTKMFSNSFQLVTRAGIERRDYVRAPDNDGTYGYAGEYARFVFGPMANEFIIGGRVLWADAETDRSSYDGWEISAVARFKLKNRWEFSPSLSYVEERYDAPATILELDGRRDRRFCAGLNALYRINERWSAEMDYSYTENSSNSPLYEYDRHLITLGVVWSF
ncbi:MAG: surface lipoprotein assembly modifier [Synergistaceae bacterium]|nr:surface lipoprotein assembly modifier [Synergistaceae bacterium]